MTYRGWLALNGVEFANSSRTVAHMTSTLPLTDTVFGGVAVADCSLAPVPGSPGLAYLPDDAVPYRPGLYYPPDGSRRFGPGLIEVGQCWDDSALCTACEDAVLYDDSWEGLAAFLEDNVYRPELAPWYTAELPESAEFTGVWVMEVTGLESTPVERNITQTAKSGGVAGPHRDKTRTVAFDALLLGCTNAGVDYGLKWLTCLLRETTDNTSTTLRYLAAHPGGSNVNPSLLVRESHGVVLTQAPTIQEAMVFGGGTNRQANVYRVAWEMEVVHPYAYLPAVKFDVDWDTISRQPVNWIHAADCTKPETCLDMPVLFSTECVPEEIARVETPPPVCGGCMPVSAIDKYSVRVPTMDYAFRCRETTVSVAIRNVGERPLTLQGFWRVCGTDVRCEDNQWPVQVSGLPANATLILDGITGRYWAWYDGMKRRPVGIVGTPNGAPWMPPLIDRQTCWDFVVQTASDSDFEVSMVLADREP